MNEWQTDAHIARYLERADEFPRRNEGERALLEFVPAPVERVLDLGTGDGRLIALVRAHWPAVEAVGLDLSEQMLAHARERFSDAAGVSLVQHDLRETLPAALGSFDLVVSSFAIHHLDDSRKRTLFAEVRRLLNPDRPFLNLEHVASPTRRLHEAFFAAIDEPLDQEDPSDRTAPVSVQLGWLRDAGFEDVDCHWKWREMALLGGRAPAL